ncbi:hypothetical protein [Nonomuraea endophytica]|uniref:Secreted protein n=1 Tax=Nonomuraea endophytica TaxID=714136 RepID=A0A7W8AF63_9ACTN|nr:hypothetical protein [Nonomuraea endophytica]MBB5083946.1 hypothetical protein [Nonomuraea endophytica]
MAHRSRIRMVLAGLSLAGLGLLAPMGSASAAASQLAPDQEVLGSQKAAAADINCWTTILQPGGNGTMIHMYYRNCGGASAVIAPTSYAVAFDGSYTHVNRCMEVPPGSIGYWRVAPSHFPPVDTTRWGFTNCMWTG